MPGALTFGVWAASSTRCVPGAQSPKMQRNLSGLNSTESLTRRRESAIWCTRPDAWLQRGTAVARWGFTAHKCEGVGLAGFLCSAFFPWPRDQNRWGKAWFIESLKNRHQRPDLVLKKNVFYIMFPHLSLLGHDGFLMLLDLLACASLAEWGKLGHRPRCAIWGT